MVLRVLLADESTALAKVFQHLKAYPLDVTHVVNGDEVLEAVTKTQPHIVFLNVLLSNKSGYDICADIKSNPSLNAIPVILLWTEFTPLDNTEVRTSQASGQLEKPFGMADVKKSLKNLFLKAEI